MGKIADEGGTIAKVKFGDIDYYNASDYFGLFAATEIKPFKIGNDLAASEGYFITQTDR